MAANILKWANKDGAFIRQASKFRNVVEKGGEFEPEADRYHLYISYACPWAHRTLIVRQLKGLDKVVGLSVVDYLMEEKGWKFSTAEETPGCIPDTLYNSNHIRDLYFRADPNYEGRFTVPVLWDKKLNTIVNNESSEIIRIFNSAFNDIAGNPGLDLCPENLLATIDETNAWVYDNLNNGVYKAGFATAQSEYEKNANLVFEAQKRIEEILKKQQFICGDVMTEADVRLFTTLIRFDPVYVGHFKCNLLAVKDCPNTLAWLSRMVAVPGIKETINMTHIKRHYYMSHKQINPTGIVPLSDGPIPL
jgi:putative glutathione S-transferase